MSATISIRNGSLWRFKGLDECVLFRVVSVSRGRNGSVKVVTVGKDEDPTTRNRADFLANFTPA